MSAPRHARRIGRLAGATLFAAASVGAVLLTACGSPAPGPGGGPSSDPNGAGVLDTGGGATTAPATATYPQTARAYAEAVLAAWDDDIDELGDLTTPEVQEQLMEVPMPLNMTWHFKQCANTAPNWVCVFFNDSGDRQSISIQDSLLGAAHAAVAVALDQTEFPTNAVTYGREFVDAWRDDNIYRMRRLADDTLANDLATDTKPAAGYWACGDGAAGSTYVRIYGGGGPEYVLRVTNATLGHPDAIVASVTPPSPPACQGIVINPSLIFPTFIFTP